MSGWRRFLFEWVALPVPFVIGIHFFVWAVASFIAWDIFWISAFWHRVMFSAISIFVWGTLIADKIPGPPKDEGPSK